MTMKEKIMTAFKNLGFELNKMDDSLYGFEYEGINFIWMWTDDEDFLSISIPAIIDFDPSNELDFYKLTDKFTATYKYVKAYRFADSMCLFYERELIGEENLELVIPHMLLQLESIMRSIREALSGMSEDGKEKADEDDDSFVIEDVEILDDND